MRFHIITNNYMILDLAINPDKIELVYNDTSVQNILQYCYKHIAEESWELVADPLGGRRARPFHCLTIIMSYTENTPTYNNMLSNLKRLDQYKKLDEERYSIYNNYDEKQKYDYCILDFSLTESALQGISTTMLWRE